MATVAPPHLTLTLKLEQELAEGAVAAAEAKVGGEVQVAIAADARRVGRASLAALSFVSALLALCARTDP